METFSALLALCAGNSPVTGEFHTQRPVTRRFDDLCLNKRLSKQSWGWWFETPSRSLWRHCNAWTLVTLDPCPIRYPILCAACLNTRSWPNLQKRIGTSRTARYKIKLKTGVWLVDYDYNNGVHITRFCIQYNRAHKRKLNLRKSSYKSLYLYLKSFSDIDSLILSRMTVSASKGNCFYKENFFHELPLRNAVNTNPYFHHFLFHTRVCQHARW